MNDSVFVVGHGNGTWRNKGVFPSSSLFKLPHSASSPAAQLSSGLLAYGILTKFSKVENGDIVLISKKTSATTSAITSIAKHLGAKVVAVSGDDLSTHEKLAAVKAQGKITVAAVHNDAKLIRSFYKAVGANGSLVVYNDAIEKFEDIDGVHLSVAHSIFDNVTVSGLSLAAWAQSDPIEFQAAVDAVSKLLEAKVLPALPPSQVYPHAKFASAVTDVLQGKPAVITF